MVRMLCSAALLVLFVIGTRAEAQPSTSRTGARRAGIDVLHYEFRVDFPARGWPDTVRFAATTTAAFSKALRVQISRGRMFFSIRRMTASPEAMA